MKWLRFPRNLGLAVCLYLAGMSAVFGLLSAQGYRFTQDARTTTGTVVALVARAPVGSIREPREGRTPSLAPTVSYQVAGQTYRITAAHGRYRQPLRVGDRITVLYSGQDPAVARIRGEGSVMAPLITVGFALAAVGVGIVLVRTRRLGPPTQHRRRGPSAKQVVKQAARAP